MANLERRENGTFRPGHVRRGGRKPGSLNRFTTLRDEFVVVFHECGGREKLQELLRNEPKAYFRLLVSLMPKIVEEPGDLEGITDLSQVSTKDLLRALNLTPVQIEDAGENE